VDCCARREVDRSVQDGVEGDDRNRVPLHLASTTFNIKQWVWACHPWGLYGDEIRARERKRRECVWWLT
jgi:hypothetical protein